jgi:N-acyl-D-amino-acid deacylase
MAKRGGHYFSHVRGEAATLETAYVEAIRIGEEGGVPVQIAHVKASGRENWGKMERALRMISDARARGVDVTGDVYPYPAGSTKMDNTPARLDARRRHRQAPRAAGRSRVAGARHRRLPGRRGALAHGLGRQWLGRGDGGHLLEGRARGENPRRGRAPDGREPAQAMMDLVLAEKAGVSMISFSQSEENVAIASADPHTMIGSDSLSLHSGTGPHPGKPHPRSYGTFPRVLGVYCRERRLFSWETAVHR